MSLEENFEKLLPSNPCCGTGNWICHTTSLELKSFSNETHSFLQLTAQLKTLTELADKLPMRQDFKGVLQAADAGYMPQQFYDDQGSSVHKFKGGYFQLSHAMKKSQAENTVDLFCRLQLVDILLSDGWELMNSAAASGLDHGSSGMLVETWIKKEKCLAEDRTSII